MVIMCQGLEPKRLPSQPKIDDETNRFSLAHKASYEMLYQNQSPRAYITNHFKAAQP